MGHIRPFRPHLTGTAGGESAQSMSRMRSSDDLIPSQYSEEQVRSLPEEISRNLEGTRHTTVSSNRIDLENIGTHQNTDLFRETSIGRAYENFLSSQHSMGDLRNERRELSVTRLREENILTIQNTDLFREASDLISNFWLFKVLQNGKFDDNKEFVELTVNVEMAISNQNWFLSTDITFTTEENYFVERIHNQIQHHLTKTMDDTLFQGMIGLSLGTLDIQGFAQVVLICFY